MDKGKSVIQYANKLAGRELKDLNICEIALLAREDWKLCSKDGKVYFGAGPYLEAMLTLNSINDDYGLDSGKSIVTYFLANAQTWRGPVAKEIKAYLNTILKGKK